MSAPDTMTRPPLTGRDASNAAARARHAARRAYVIGEVEWLLGTDSVENISTRLGYANPRSLARKLRDWKQPELAAVIAPARVQRTRNPATNNAARNARRAAHRTT